MRGVTSGPLSVADVLQTRTFLPDSVPSFSPDSQEMVYTLRRDLGRGEDTDERYHWFNRRGVTTFAGEGGDIYLTDIRTGRTRNLTGGVGTSWNPVFSPDGKWVAFYSDRDGMARLWVWEHTTGSIRRICDAMVRPLFNREAPVWLPDNRRILTKLLPAGESIASFADRFLVPEEKNLPAGGVRVYRAGGNAAGGAPTPTEGRSLTNRARADLAIVEIGSGAVRRVATDIYPYDYRLTPDGRSVLYTQIRKVAFNPAENLCDLAMVETGGGRSRLLAREIRRTWWGTGARLSPDGTRVAYLSFGEQETTVSILALSQPDTPRIAHVPVAYVEEAPLWSNDGAFIFLIAGNRVWRIEARTGVATPLVSPPDLRLRQLVADSCYPDRLWRNRSGMTLVRFRRDTDKREGFLRLSTNPEARQSDVSISWQDAARLGRAVGISAGVVFERQSGDSPPNLWSLMASGQPPRPRTQANPALEQRNWGQARVVEWKTTRGETARGALFLPPDFTAGHPVPLLVRVYAGASLSNLVNAWGGWNGGVDNAHLYTSRGIAVLLPDIPFRYTQAMTDIPGAVLPALDTLVAEGIADESRLGLFGHSQGGYTALALLTQTKRFRCAAVVCGFGNLFGAYGQMQQDGEANDIAFREFRMGGTPWEQPDLYRANSPAFFLPNITTPLLLIHGDADRSVQPFLANEIFVGLRRLGREVEYALYRGEGHVPDRWSPANRQDYAERVLRWFTTRLR